LIQLTYTISEDRLAIMSCRTPNDGALFDLSLIPSPVLETCRHLNQFGGNTYLVGGVVRDLTLGITPKDFDIEVYGLSEKKLLTQLNKLGRTELVGKQFGVIKLWCDHLEIDIALPRTEYKTAKGHRGFDVKPNPGLSPEIASLRRDFTINAMMYDPIENRLCDFHGGREDLQSGILRHVSSAFAEDPLRVLRAMQFAARFKLVMASETASLCKGLLSEADTLPSSRVWIEWQKWSHAKHPSFGLRILRDTGWLELYPELTALINCPQDPKWHPEGDVWGHTLQVVDQAAALAMRYNWNGELREYLLLAALCHDLGKPACTFKDDKGTIRSPGHSNKGKEFTRTFLKKIAAPKRVDQFALPLIQEHMAHMHGAPTPRAIRNLAHRLSPATIELWEALVEADASGRSPAPASRPAGTWLKQAEEMQHQQEKPAPIVTGKTHMGLCISAGPQLGEILKQAYQAQLDGVFDSSEQALQWCAQRVTHAPHNKPEKTE
jgi:tRNA nucleotidyltransferase (CCA-adding enzyme)